MVVISNDGLKSFANESGTASDKYFLHFGGHESLNSGRCSTINAFIHFLNNESVLVVVLSLYHSRVDGAASCADAGQNPDNFSWACNVGGE